MGRRKGQFARGHKQGFLKGHSQDRTVEDACAEEQNKPVSGLGAASNLRRSARRRVSSNVGFVSQHEMPISKEDDNSR